MKRQVLTGAMLSTSVMSLIGLNTPVLSQTARPTIKLTTQPAIDQVVPFKQPVHLSLSVVDTQGNAVKSARVKLQIQTPSPTPWFTTDFPIVEGTKLLTLDTVAPDGKLDFQQVFPIRGTYKFTVTATPLTPQAFESVQQTLELTVPESPGKYRNLLILIVLLLGIGWLGGQIIGRQHPRDEGEIAPQPVRLLLSSAIGVVIVALFIINVSAERSESHNHDEHHHPEASVTPSSEGNLKFSGDNFTKVGQLANLAVQAIDSKGQPLTQVSFNIKTIQLEDNELTFAYQTTADQLGQVVWQQQFFDGAPHAIEVTATPQAGATNQFKPITSSRTIMVEGVAPPLFTRLVSLAYFTSIVGLGMGIGLWQQQSKLKKQSL